MAGTNSNKTATKRVPGKPFEPGKTGNPNGRPKIDPDIKEMCRAACPAAIQRVVDIVMDPRTKQSDAIRGAEFLADRGYGKAHQSVDVTAQVDANVTQTLNTDGMSIDDKVKLAALLAKAQNP